MTGNLAKGAESVRSAGLKIAWHNHDFEYRKLSDGSRPIDHLFAAPGLAWQDSRTRPYVDTLVAAVRALSSAERVRLLGWMLAVALVTRAVLYVVSGAQLTMTTLVVWGMVMAVAAIMMAAAHPVANAWDDWNARRL